MIWILQQIDGNIIAPKIIGSSVGLSSFWVLFAILLFGGLYGFFGMIIGSPIFAVIYHVIGKAIRKYAKIRGEHEFVKNYEDEFLSRPARPSFRHRFRSKENKEEKTETEKSASAENAEYGAGEEKDAAVLEHNGETTENTVTATEDEAQVTAG